MKKIVLRNILILILFFSFLVNVNATSFESNVSVSKKNIKQGEDVVITLKLDNYKDVNKGFYAYKATINYDKNVFEDVKEDDFTLLNDWTGLEYNSNNGQFIIYKKCGSKVGEELLKISLKVKKNANEGNTKIYIKDMVASEGNKDIYLKNNNDNSNENPSVKLQIIKKSVSTSQNNSVTNNNTNKNNNTNQNNSNDNVDEEDKNDIGSIDDVENSNIKDEIIQKDKRTENKKIKKSTKNYFWIFLIVIVILIIIIGIIKKYGNSKKALMCIGILIIGSLPLIHVLATASKGELNEDGTLNYLDAKLLELHLIDKESLPKNILDNADMNYDNVINVTDLALLIQKIEKKLNYEATLKDISISNRYPSKNDEILIEFYARVTDNEPVKMVTINEIEYPAEQLETENDQIKYKIKLKVPNTSGKKEYKITKILLENEKYVKVDNTIQIDVVKDKPQVINYKMEETNEMSKVNFSFDIVDDDNSITTANFSLISGEDTILSKKINKGSNTINSTLDIGKEYKVKIVMLYDLDSNTLADDIDNSGKVEVEKSFKFIDNYKFVISEISTYKDNVKTTLFEKNDSIVLRFKSNNLTEYIPQYIVVNNKSYEVHKVENQVNYYEAILNDITASTIKIENVILSNGKIFSVENEITISWLNIKPSVKDNFEYEESDSAIDFAFTIVDDDNTISKAKIVLYDAQGKLISSEDISLDEINSGRIHKKMTTSFTSMYRVQILANYSLDGKTTTENNVIYTQDINAKTKVTFDNISVSQKFYEKGSIAELEFKITKNVSKDVISVYINSKECKVVKQSADTYKAYYNVDSTSGIIQLNISAVEFIDETIDVEANTEVEVLKDSPIISNYKQEDKLSTQEVTLSFNIEDSENSFISAKAVLTDNSGTEVQSTSQTPSTLQVGKNSVTFKVTEQMLYTFRVYVTYGRNEAKTEEYIVTDKKIYESSVELLENYALTLDNIKSYKEEKEDTEILYFNKNEKVILHFNSTNNSAYNLYRIFVSGTDMYSEMQATPTMIDSSTSLYKVVLNSYNTTGVKEIKINSAVLLNAKKLSLENKSIKIEVIKDKPYVEKFSYKIEQGDKITASFTVKDPDSALKDKNSKKDITAIVVDENGTELTRNSLIVGDNAVEFLKNDSASFTLKIIGSYDLDSNELETGKNEATDKVLLEAPINVSNRSIEIKDITNVYLYKQSGSNLEIVSVANVNELDSLSGNYDNYLIKVEMKDLPSFYSKIKEHKVENNTLKFILDYDNAVQYENDSKHDWIEVEYPSTAKTNSYIKINSIEQLKNEADNDGWGNYYELTADLDASAYTSGEAIISNFKGILIGNNHKIKNLKIPLFNSFTGEISNVTFENARVSGSKAYGIVANTSGDIMNSRSIVKFTNVHIINSSITAPNATGTGGFVGKSYYTDFEKCSVQGLTIGTNSYIGGFVGDFYASTIKSSYITNSTITSNKGSVGGSKAGGLVGVAEAGSYIENSYANVEVNFVKGSTTLGGLIGYPLSVTVKNSLSLATGSTGYGSTYRIYGTHTDGAKISTSSSNNYELATSNLISNASNSAVKTVTPAELATVEFYTNKLKWSTSTWDFSAVNESTGPMLKNSDPNYQNRGIENNKELYIPNYSTFKNLKDFDSNKVILYSNLYKIMPFYETKYLIEEGKKVPQDDILNQKAIKIILPLDKNKNLITTLTEKNYSSIAYVKIIFKDNTSNLYNMKFDEIKSNVATYKLGKYGLCYNFNKYIVNENAEIVTTLLDYANSLSYGAGVSANTHRIYKDNYNNVTKKNLKNIILMVLQSDEKYAYTVENSILDDIIVKELITNKKLNKILYAYNYYDRWYSVTIGNDEIGKINVDELMLLYGDIFSDGMSIENLTSDIFTSNVTLSTSETDIFYRNVLANYTNKAEVGDYFDYLIETFTEYEDVNDWLKYDYKGIVYETPAEGHPNIEYRAWALFKKQSKYLLPFITLPANSAYVISCPTQLIIGAQRSYIANPNDATQHAQLVQTVESFGKNVGKFYTTTAGFVEESTLNSAFTLSIDYQWVKGYSTRQAAGTAEEPFHKNFNDALDLWAQKWGSAAHTIAGVIYWDVNACLTYYYAWSHETGHDQADKVFFNGIDVRSGAGGEDYPDGNTTQSDGVNFNLTYSYSVDSNIMGNLTPERINSKEKIYSYYKEMFETVYFLDYVEAQAFLTLTPEEQAKLATKVSDGDNTTAYRAVTVEQIKAMNLKTIEDLYKNKIILRSSKGTVGPMQYGSENIFTARRWYQAHNDGGRTDSNSFKYLAWEMLGVAGYNDGYITYYSSKSANDLDAIRKVTKDNTMTWEKYKLGRFASTANNLVNMKYLDVEELKKLYIRALKEDAANNDESASRGNAVRRNTYNYLKRVTDDFRTGIYEDEKLIHITTAEEFQTKIMQKQNGNFILDNDIDLSSLTGTEAIITKNFLGKLNGNGHTISGSKLPLFAKTTNAYIENLKLDSITITSTTEKTGALINTASGTSISNIKMNKIKVTGTTEVGGLVGYISSHSYIKDIEAIDISINGNMQIGGIVGKTENYVTINNISINKNISGTTSSRQIGTLVGSITNTSIENVHILESKITGLNNVSGFVGFGSSSTINKVSTNSIIKSTGEKSGGLFGEISSVTIKNSYATGEINGNSLVGGLVGIATKSTIDSCYTNFTIKGTTSVGGFIGQTKENSKITNNISYSSVNTGYKFDGATDSSQFTNYKNNYEFKLTRGNTGEARTDVDLSDKIIVLENNEAKTKEFYTNTLSWNNEIWDLTNVENSYIPKLNSTLDKNNLKLPIGEIIEINNITDFKNIKNDLYATYEITTDTLDFGSENFLNTPIINGTFKGTIIGNGVTIKNFKNGSLFKNFEGKIENVTIKNFQYIDYLTEQVNIFASSTKNAIIRNIKIDGYEMYSAGYGWYYIQSIGGRSNTALISGIDNGSIVENITVTNVIYKTAETTNDGKDIAILFGEKTGGKIENIYVDLTYYRGLSGGTGWYSINLKNLKNYNSSGGLVGTLKGDAKIKNVIMINDYSKLLNNGSNNAGFIGNIEDASDELLIENSIQLGEVVEDTPSKPVYKFAGFGEDLIKKYLKNCYEVKEKSGTSSVTENTKGSLDEISKSGLTVDFYKSMGFDENLWNFDTISTKGYPTLK